MNLCNLYYEKLNLDRYFSKNVLPYLTLHELKKDDFVCQYGDQLDTFYFHVDGQLQVYRMSSNGKAVVLMILEPGENIGDVEFISKQPVTSYVQAISDVKLLGIPFDVLRNEFYDDVKFLHFIIESLAGSLVSQSKNYVDNQTYTLEQRLAGFMIQVENERGNVVIFKMMSLADWFGVSYRHLSRVLKKFEEEKLIYRDKKKITILDHDTLSDIANQ